MVICEPNYLHAIVMGLKKNMTNSTRSMSRYLIRQIDEASTKKFFDQMDDSDDIDKIFHNSLVINELKKS